MFLIPDLVDQEVTQQKKPDHLSATRLSVGHGPVAFRPRITASLALSDKPDARVA